MQKMGIRLHYKCISSSILSLRVWHRSMNRCLLHLRVTPRLGAKTGGSGNEDKTKKLMESSRAVMMEYQHIINILLDLQKLEPSSSEIKKVCMYVTKLYIFCEIQSKLTKSRQLVPAISLTCIFRGRCSEIEKR